MKTINLAVFFGGCSSEYSVSLQSAYAVLKNLDRTRFRPVPVGITKNGGWYFYGGDIEKIRRDTWLGGDCIAAVLSPSRERHALMLFREGRVSEIPVDAAFPVLHGKNGEDGTIQGLIELAGIPLAGCGTLASALCMDKERAHRLAAAEGVEIPESRVFGKTDLPEAREAFAEKIGYPLFVKPVRSGSSYGVTKVLSSDGLLEAVRIAFAHDDRVLLEENIEGFEVGCAVMGNKRLITGEIDEIELSGGFFDFTEKYTLKTSAIHVPARISRQQADRVRQTAKRIYRALGCSGFARVDLFLTPEGRLVFNEVNTIPGFTEHSRYPAMMKAAGYSFREIVNAIAEEALRGTEGTV